MHENYYIGIDLGTTNSSMHWGYYNPDKKTIEPKGISFDQITASELTQRTLLLPSFIWFKKDSSRTNIICGEYAKSSGMESQASRVAFAIKNHMGDPSWHFNVDDKSYSASDLASELLKVLYQGIRTRFMREIKDVVITVPACFESEMRKDTLEAARKAGFNTNGISNMLLDEPTAALLDLINQQKLGDLPIDVLDLSTPKTVLMFDLGGGTLDVSMHIVEKDNSVMGLGLKDLGLGRYSQLGGHLFDRLVASELQKRFENTIGQPIDDNSKISKFELNQIKMKLLMQAESVKIRLTQDIQNQESRGISYEEIPDDYSIDVTMPFLWNLQSLNTQFSKKDFYSAIEPLLGNELNIDLIQNSDISEILSTDNVIYPILDVLEKAKKKTGVVNKIDAVILTGGMTRVHAIKQRLNSFFKMQTIPLLDPEHAVSRGAAVYHYFMTKGWTRPQILNDTISIETSEKTLFPLVKAGTILPYSDEIKNKLIIMNENIKHLDVPLYRGEGKYPAPPNIKMIDHRFRFDRVYRSGTQLNIQVSIDTNKIVHFIGVLPDGELVELTCEIEGHTEHPKPINNPIIKPNHDDPRRIMDVHHLLAEFKTISLTDDQSRLKQLGKDALRAKNIPEIIDALLTLKDVGIPGKARIMYILGEYVLKNPNDSFRNDQILDLCIKSTSQKHFNQPYYINTVGRYAVCAMGKFSTSSMIESHLLSLLRNSSLKPVRSDILFSLGKIGYTSNSITALSQYLNSSLPSDRIPSAWALGRLGSRERDNTFLLKHFDSVINKLIKKANLDLETHPIACKYAVYALGEIGDRRRLKGEAEVIDNKVASNILLALKNLLNQASAYCITSRTEEIHINNIILQIALSEKLIKGISLNDNETRVLLSVRSLVSVKNEE